MDYIALKAIQTKQSSFCPLELRQIQNEYLYKHMQRLYTKPRTAKTYGLHSIKSNLNETKFILPLEHTVKQAKYI